MSKHYNCSNVTAGTAMFLQDPDPSLSLIADPDEMTPILIRPIKETRIRPNPVQYIRLRMAKPLCCVPVYRVFLLPNIMEAGSRRTKIFRCYCDKDLV